MISAVSTRPLNTFDTSLWKSLGDAVDAASANPDVRAVVLASALDAGFSAGLDLSHPSPVLSAPLEPARKALAIQAYLKEFQSSISALERCAKPVLVAIHGLCLGLAIDIASAGDVRIALDSTVFAIAEVDVGLAADIGTLQRFPKKVIPAFCCVQASKKRFIELTLDLTCV